MKKIAIFTAAITVSATAMAAPAIPRDEQLERRLAQVVGSLSLEEKVGQMCELTLGVIGRFDPSQGDSMTPDPAKLNQLVAGSKVGSFLNVADIALTPEQWVGIIQPIQAESMKALKVPTIFGLDMNHGASYTIGATLMPQNINIGATFNPELARRGGEITAYETRACDVPWTYNPTVDLARNPLWPRFWENYGEDPLVNALMGRAAVEGLQGTDPNHIDRFHIAANLKHFMGYGSPVSGKDRTHSAISEQEMREKHFAPYLEGIRNGHALSIMVNSTTNNGEPFHANARYLTQWLKEQLEWDGMIVTDWNDINNLWQREMVAPDKKTAIAMAINAGIDMAMEPYHTDFCPLLIQAVNEGLVSMERIDDAVSRIIRLKMRLGLFDTPNTLPKDYPLFGSEEFAASSRQAAVESMVLLENNGVLPLSPDTKILLAGPNANSMRCLNGGWTYTWQGHLTDTLPISERYNTILKALRNRFGADNVAYEPGVTYESAAQWKGNWGVEIGDDASIAAAVSAARDVDVIIAAVGETSYCETPGNIDDLRLSPLQTRLVNALADTGKPVVLILNEGRPRLLGNLPERSAAVVDIMLPSNYGGDALAALLAGDENFSGRLPFTYPKHPGALVAYDYRRGEVAQTMEGAYNYEAAVDVQWPFGSGRSYTTFEYSNLRCNPTEFTAHSILTVSVDVTNTGTRRGKESVLLFSSDLVASISPEARRLRAFDKVDLQPGQTTTVTFQLPAKDLAFVNFQGQWTLEKGDFRLMVANQAVTVNATSTHTFSEVNP